MGWYRVQGPAPSRRPTLPFVAAACVVVAVGLISFRTFPTVPVTVGGLRVSLTSGATAEEALRSRLGTLPAGDVRSIADGSVVATGGGESPLVWVNGRRAGIGTRLYARDEVRWQRGADVTESVVTTRVGIPIPVRVEGSGPLVQLVNPGAVGVQVRRIGEFSGEVLSERILSEPVAMVYRRQSPTKAGKYVALTFDDGPWPRQTEAVLSVLADEDVKATFFMVGLHVQKSPAIARKVAEAGHLIGNHTMAHRRLGDATWQEAAEEIRRGEAAIERATGIRPKWFRPPGGQTNRNVYRVCGKLGLRLALWNVDTRDWTSPGTRAIIEGIDRDVRPGAVVLLHDGGGDRRQTVWALRKAIRRLKADGYTFVTLDQLPSGAGWRR